MIEWRRSAVRETARGTGRRCRCRAERRHRAAIARRRADGAHCRASAARRAPASTPRAASRVPSRASACRRGCRSRRDPRARARAAARETFAMRPLPSSPAVSIWMTAPACRHASTLRRGASPVALGMRQHRHDAGASDAIELVARPAPARPTAGTPRAPRASRRARGARAKIAARLVEHDLPAEPQLGDRGAPLRAARRGSRACRSYGASVSTRHVEVRREHDALDAVGGERSQHGDRRLDRARAVVDARQQVRVDVDHRATARQRSRVVERRRAPRCAPSPLASAPRAPRAARSPPRTRTSPARPPRAGRAPNRATSRSSREQLARRVARRRAGTPRTRRAHRVAASRRARRRCARAALAAAPGDARRATAREVMRSRAAPRRALGASLERRVHARRVGNSRLRHVRLAAAAATGDRGDVADDRVGAKPARAQVVGHDGEQRALAVLSRAASSPTPLASCSRSASPSA